MNPTPDITQHPLYRPHHGDMKGWRYIQDGDVRCNGDEFFDNSILDDSWEPIPFSNYGRPYNLERATAANLAYRRRISPESKPADQKRFVTVVFPADVPNLEIFVQFSHAFREGNALAALDGIEDRAIEAVRQAVKGGAK